MTQRKKMNNSKGIESWRAQIIIGLIITLILFFAMLPIIVTLLSSFKSNYEIAQGIWKLPGKLRWSNWAVGLGKMKVNLFNSIVVCTLSSIGIVVLASIVAYVFTRHKFIGKEIIFYGIIALMIVPMVLTLTPSYLLMVNLGLTNTWWALLLPYISGGQIGAIFLFRTFFSQQPAELFEAAKIDGANDFKMFIKITIPLAVPILAIQAVTSFSGLYNDFLWPTLVIGEESKQTLMPVLRAFTNEVQGITVEKGPINAIYLMSGIPLIFTTAFGLKYFINGDFASGIKL